MSMLPSVADMTSEAEEPTIEEYMAALLARTNHFDVAGRDHRAAAKPTGRRWYRSSSPPASPQCGGDPC